MEILRNFKIHEIVYTFKSCPPKSTHTTVRFEGGMRNGAMKGQNKSFLLFRFYFGKEAKASALLLCCQVGLVFHDAGEEPIKAHSIQGAREQLLQDKQGSSPPSSRPRTWSLTPWPPAGRVM